MSLGVNVGNHYHSGLLPLPEKRCDLNAITNFNFNKCEWSRLIRHLITEGGLIGLSTPLEPYPVAYLRDPSTPRVVLKSRQVGFSWIFAAEALLHALMSDRSTSLFISLGQREAQEKVRYAQELHDALPARFRARNGRGEAGGDGFLHSTFIHVRGEGAKDVIIMRRAVIGRSGPRSHHNAKPCAP